MPDRIGGAKKSVGELSERHDAVPHEQVQGKKDAWGWRCLVDVLPQPLSTHTTNHHATHSLLLTIKSLLHYFFAVDNIYTLRQVFYFTAELRAAERIDALLSSSVDRRRVDAGRISFDDNLSLYEFSAKSYTMQALIERSSGRLGNIAVFQREGIEVADRTLFSFCCYRSVSDK